MGISMERIDGGAEEVLERGRVAQAARVVHERAPVRVLATTGAKPRAVEEDKGDKARQAATSRWGLGSLASVGKRLLDALPDD